MSVIKTVYKCIHIFSSHDFRNLSKHIEKFYYFSHKQEVTSYRGSVNIAFFAEIKNSFSSLIDRDSCYLNAHNLNRVSMTLGPYLLVKITRVWSSLNVR